jgi:CHAD domain
MMTTDRTAIRRRLTVRRTAHRPPWGGRKAGHRSIVAPLAATVAATVAVGIGLALARTERERRAARAAGLGERERYFGLLPDENAADGLRRIALGQLDLAIELLRGESSVPPQEAVHETRKALKRLRALVRLLEGELGTKRSARERAILRDAAARLAGARDAEVMVSTLDALVRRHPRKLGRRRGMVELGAHLRDERRRAADRALGDAATRTEVADELTVLRTRVASWRLADRAASRLVEPGLERIYRAGRAGRRRADRSGAKRHKPDSRAMHRWRKHVKDLRYAAEILDVRDPPEEGSAGRSDQRTGKHSRKHADKRMGRHSRKHKHKAKAKRSGGRADGGIAKLARRADALGEKLGEEHDLMLLAERVRSHKPLKRRRRTQKLLLRAISRRRALLRVRALREGRRLYERKPQRFIRRVRAASRARARRT